MAKKKTNLLETLKKIFSGLFISWKVIIALGVTFLVVTGSILFGTKLINKLQDKTLYETKKYYTVYLQEGLFYFCKLHDYNSEYLECRDPYYLVRDQVKNAQGKLEDKIFVKRPADEEIYKPSGAMFLKKDRIVYIVKIDDNSPVLKYMGKK